MFRHSSHQLLDNPPALHYGAAAVDIDGDGLFEVVVAGFLGPNRVLKWNGKGFVDVAESMLADVKRKTIGVAGCDLDGDGREEIYFLNTDTFAGPKRHSDTLLKHTPDGWIDLFHLDQNVEFANLTAGRSVAVLDRQGNGRYGFVVANYAGPLALFEADTEGRVRDVAPQARIDRVTGGRGLVCAPLFESPLPDLFCNNENGPNFLFRNLGDGRFDEVAALCGVADAGLNGRGVAVLDARRDRRLDLVCANWEGPARLYRQRERGRYEEATPPALDRPGPTRTVVVADFDHDGHEEIFFNNLSAPNRLFGWRQGGWVELDVGEAAEAGAWGTGAVVGDFDQDGRLELLICHGEEKMESLSLFRPESVGHHLRVMPLTTAGAPARGARVIIRAGDREQVRIIDGGSGYLCQMEPVAHFGLGPLTEVEEVEIRWPDGAEVKLGRQSAEQTLKVRHP
ncbi:MAG: CRTAC1 family protein [Vulcanimicrobiota bacterium]